MSRFNLTNIERLCKDLNEIVGEDIWYDTFHVRNTKCPWLMNVIVTAMDNDKVLCGCFETYPTYLAAVLHSVNDIKFYFLCNEKLNYVDYIEKYILGKNCIISHTGNYFLLSSGTETIVISFEVRITHGKLLSELTFAYSVLNKIYLSSLDLIAYNLHAPNRLGNCKLYTRYCSAHPYKRFPSVTLFCTKKSHRIYWNTRCHCKLYVKTGPSNLTSQCVNKLREFTQ